ncbi:hypothetical protein ACFXJ8_23335 [Nonomuraea sp. NPDC059194]|uniref:hypothetical protein n=1 Tax=Nonomuraea sp. NPDC059194 TaxID=3346764 RepID=UPI0036A64379
MLGASRRLSGAPGVGRFLAVTLLTGAGAAALVAALPTGRAEALALATLPPGAPDRRLFAPAEQRFATYLTTLAPMVHDMDASGFFAGGWWRNPAAPYNARVQEHVYTLAWFLTQQRAWNPYAGEPAHPPGPAERGPQQGGSLAARRREPVGLAEQADLRQPDHGRSRGCGPDPAPGP